MARIYRKDSVKWELRKKTSEEARKALRGVMESRNLAYLDAARGVGVTREAVRLWLEGGDLRPKVASKVLAWAAEEAKKPIPEPVRKHGWWFKKFRPDFIPLKNIPKPPKPTDEERFWQYVTKTNTCWVWTGSQTRSGYGKIWWPPIKNAEYAHRASWRIAHDGNIPKGKIIAQTCGNSTCIRPDHLIAQTFGERNRWWRERIQWAPHKKRCKTVAGVR